MAGLTPMMKQYQEIKAKYPEAILFFRLGDFYEMFFDDALEASKLLQITLTARNKGENQMPMCGIPYHAAGAYISKLTKAGKKVAICEQLSDPNEPGIVQRDVVRVITPGTTLDDNLLERKANNFLLAVIELNGIFGLAYCDVSTGEFKVTQIKNEKDLLTELERVYPAEVLVPSNLMQKLGELLKNKLQCFCFEQNFVGDAKLFLQDHFGVKNLDGFGLANSESKILATALLYKYLKETQKTDLAHIRKVQSYELSEFMPLDEATLKNLELVSTLRENKLEGSLLWVLDETLTSMGGRLLRFLITHPLYQTSTIQKRLDAVEELTLNSRMLDDLREILKNILDLERLMARLSLGQGNARDLVALKNSLMTIPYIQSVLMAFHSEMFADLLLQLNHLPELVSLIDRSILDEVPMTIKDGGMIKDGYDNELDELKKISREGKYFIQSLQEKEIERTGINSLKIRYNQVFGYYIEISKANLAAVPQDYIRKQTLVNAERFITPELKEYEEKVLGAEEKIMKIEFEIFMKIRGETIKEVEKIQKLAHAIAMLDALSSLAIVAINNRYTKPLINDGERIVIQAGRHPVVEKMSFAAQFVANDLDLNVNEKRIALITGPNMGGKSTFLRQTALITLMAQIGSFVPAAHAEIGLVDRIFTRVGASDNLVRGQSTFMVEMQETSFILNHATAKSLIILDEIGRGTSTYDGMSLAWAILEYIHDVIGAKTLFATHYHELIALAEKLPHARNCSVAVKEEHDGVVFLYKIVEGGVDRSYGIEVAKLAGLPSEVIAKAKQILVNLEEGVVEVGIQNQLLNPEVRKDENQLGIFQIDQSRIHQNLVNDPALAELKELDVNKMTPLDALQKLADLQKKLS